MIGPATRRLGLALTLVAVLVGLGLLIGSRDRPPASERAATIGAPGNPETRTYASLDTVRRGDTLAGLFFRNRLDMQQIDRLLREIRSRGYFEPRRIKPGQIIEFVRDESGRVVEVTCRLKAEQAYLFEIDPGNEAIRSRALEIETERRVRKLAGPVRSTYEEAVLAAGGRVGLAVQVSEIFSGDIDFFTEVRRGDSFSLLVEEKYVGDQFVGYGEVLFGWYRGKEANAVCAYYEPNGGQGGYYDMEGKSLRRLFLRSPLTYRRISSYFTNRRFHPILKKYRPHHGVDYAAPTGTPVSAVCDGRVTYAGWKSGLGRMVEIRHNSTYTTRYGHLSRLAKGIRKGVRIRQGDKIGYVGATGLATGPHLHYEMRANGRPINPLRMKRAPAEPIPPEQLADYLELAEELASAEAGLQPGALLQPEAWAGFLVTQTGSADSSSTVN